jgi:hypothetical protein
VRASILEPKVRELWGVEEITGCAVGAQREFGVGRAVMHLVIQETGSMSYAGSKAQADDMSAICYYDNLLVSRFEMIARKHELDHRLESASEIPRSRSYRSWYASCGLSSYNSYGAY